MFTLANNCKHYISRLLPLEELSGKRKRRCESQKQSKSRRMICGGDILREEVYSAAGINCNRRIVGVGICNEMRWQVR
jgi:hypothetical protein